MPKLQRDAMALRAECAAETAARKAAEERAHCAEMNADEAAQSAAEAWAQVAALISIIEDVKAVKAISLYRSLKKHHEHVVECRKGSCRHEFDALVKHGLANAT